MEVEKQHRHRSLDGVYSIKSIHSVSAEDPEGQGTGFKLFLRTGTDLGRDVRKKIYRGSDRTPFWGNRMEWRYAGKLYPLGISASFFFDRPHSFISMGDMLQNASMNVKSAQRDFRRYCYDLD